MIWGAAFAAPFILKMFHVYAQKKITIINIYMHCYHLHTCDNLFLCYNVIKQKWLFGEIIGIF